MYKTEFEKRNLVIATNLAQEEIELVRNIRDNNWKLGCTAFNIEKKAGCREIPDGTFYLDYQMTQAISCAPGNDVATLYRIKASGFYTYTASDGGVENSKTKFRRYFSVSGDSNNNSKKITVFVVWRPSGASSDAKVEMEDTLYAWTNPQ